MSGLELMLPPFVACMILAAIHSYLGLHVIAREVIFVDLSLAQMAALGTTAGLLMGVNPGSTGSQLFAFAFVVIGAALFAATRTHGKGRVPQEAIIGIVYVVASAAALLMADKAPRGADAIKDVLVGTILWVTWPAIARLAVAYAICGVALFLLRKRFEAISFHPEESEAKGWSLRWWDFWFYLIFGAVITFSVPLGGVLMVFSFLVVPAVVAFLFTRRPGLLTLMAWGTGTLASALGLVLSYRYDLPTGPTIVCSYGVVLMAAGVVRKVLPDEAAAARSARSTFRPGSSTSPAPQQGVTVLGRSLIGLGLALVPTLLSGQVPGKFPPDSLVNTQVIPHNTPVNQVIGTMRNFTGDLGVRCQFCHVGEEGMPLERFDFAKDQKDTKLIARQMMRMVAEINRRLDTLPGRAPGDPVVTCRTCHHGVNLPVPLPALIQDAAAAGPDSAIRAYRALRARYYGRDAYDFGEPSLNIAAFRLARAGKFPEALALLGLNEEFYPGSSGMYVFRGNVLLMRGDTAGSAMAYREAIRRDSTNGEARGRLRDIGQRP